MMGLRRNSAHRMMPVRPKPPMVARNSSLFCSGEQVRRWPFERRSSKQVTWQPNVPLRWWFLPCMSLAMAPPTDTNLVPGVTGRNQPRGTMMSSISARDTPASQRKRPVCWSKEMKRCRCVRSSDMPFSLRQLSP